MIIEEIEASSTHDIQVLTANIQGATTGTRYDFGLKCLINQKPDIILIQELWSMVPNPDLLQHLSDLDYDSSIYTPDSYDKNVRGTGTGMLTANRTATSKAIDCKKFNERISILSLEQPKLEIINIYAPTSSKSVFERDNFFSSLTDLIFETAKSEDNILIGGDFNVDPAKNPLSKITNLKLITADKPTHQSGSNLDYFYATKSLDIKNCKIVVNGSSDHDSFLISLSVPVFELQKECHTEFTAEKLTIPKTDAQIQKFKLNISNFINGNLGKKEQNFLENIKRMTKTTSPSDSSNKALSNILQVMEDAIKSAAKKQVKSKTLSKKASTSWSPKCTEIYEEMKFLKNLCKNEENIRMFELRKKELKAEIRKIKVKENEKAEDELLDKFKNDINGFYKKVK